MTIYLGADHGGFNLKEYLKDILKNDGYDVVDCGPSSVLKAMIIQIMPLRSRNR